MANGVRGLAKNSSLAEGEPNRSHVAQISRRPVSTSSTIDASEIAAFSESAKYSLPVSEARTLSFEFFERTPGPSTLTEGCSELKVITVFFSGMFLRDTFTTKSVALL
jgi:hypothetical protein